MCIRDRNEPERDPCRCAARTCRGFINFDLSDRDAALVHGDSADSVAVRQRLSEYSAYLASIGQEQVEDTIVRTLETMRARG